MVNPFKYGSVIGIEAFCNRKKEIAKLIRIIENSEKAFLYSERRFGKTSLINLVLNKLPRKEYITIYIDIWPTDGERSFITTVARTLTQSLSTTVEKSLTFAKQIFRHLSPSISIDEEGKPILSFGIIRSDSLEPELEEVMNAPEKIASAGKKKVVVVFDEMQRIMEYESDLVKRKLRSVIQHHKNVSYIFLGSRKHLIQEMFLNKSRPLYHSATHIPLNSISTEDWIPFIRKRFTDANKNVTDDIITKICNLTQGHPFYTQYLCHLIWELCEPKQYVNESLLNESLVILFARENYAYTLLWESLTINQQRFLKALASEVNSIQPYSADFLKRHSIGSPSSLQRIIQGLIERDIIERENGTLVILDRFFRLWVQKLNQSVF